MSDKRKALKKKKEQPAVHHGAVSLKGAPADAAPAKIDKVK
jgi:hypothetical protein